MKLNYVSASGREREQSKEYADRILRPEVRGKDSKTKRSKVRFERSIAPAVASKEVIVTNWYRCLQRLGAQVASRTGDMRFYAWAIMKSLVNMKSPAYLAEPV